MKVSRRQQSKSVSPSNFELSLPKTHLAGGWIDSGILFARWIVISCAAWHAALSVAVTGLEIEAVTRAGDKTQSWQSAREL